MIKKFWMPVVAGLCVISGLGDFNLGAIMLGAGFGLVWWKDVRGSSCVDKKFVASKIIRWLLAGVGCDMLIHGSVAEGVVVLGIVLMWATGKFSKLKLPQIKFRGVGSPKKKEKKSGLEVEGEVSDAWRQKIRNDVVRQECLILLDNAYLNTKEHDNYFSHKLFKMLQYATRHGYEHSVNKIDLFSCKIARVQMTFETRKWQKTSCEVSSTQSIGMDHNQLDIWSLPVGGQASTYAFKECNRCHGHKHITCPKCHGEHAQWECPDCHGEKGLHHECQVCHGKGESKCLTCQGKGIVTCKNCNGSGKRSCSVCHGSGWVSQYDKYEMQNVKATCPNCHGKGTDTCIKCGGSGESRCGDCGGRGMAVCQNCDGTGKTLCEKCDSTGTAYCHTCDGTGEVVCPECNGVGGSASLWKVVRDISRHEKIEAWSDDGLPKALLPKIFPAPDAINGCESLYSVSSESTTPDDSLVLSETALKYSALKSMFDSIASSVQAGRHVHVTQQSVELVEIHDIARVEIESNYISQYPDEYAGKTFICWLNLATGELLDIGFKSERPDSWYESHELSESDRSPYQMLAKIKDGDEDYNEVIELAYTLGNPFAMAEYGRILYEGKTKDKKANKQLGCLLQRLAEYVGVKNTLYASTFSWSNMRYGDHDQWRNTQSSLWGEVLPRFIKLIKHADEDCARVIFGQLEVCGIGASPYRLRDLPLEYVQNLFRYSSSKSEDRDVGFAVYKDVGQLSDEQCAAVLRNCPRAYQIMAKRNAFTPAEFGVALWRSSIDRLIERYGFDKASKSYTMNEWYEFFMASDNSLEAERIVKRIDWKQIELLPLEKWTRLFNCPSGFKIEKAIDWKWMANMHLEKVILLAHDVSSVDANVDWGALQSQLESFDWQRLTDDQRVTFAIDHEEQAEIALKCGFDPNKLRPWCVDLSYDKWPDRMSTFNPDVYDWSQCSPRMWAQIAYGHPEFVKYCPVDEIDWHKLDDEKIKYWKWALGAFGEKIVRQFTKWDELDEERWNDILKKQPALADYKKKYGKKS